MASDETARSGTRSRADLGDVVVVEDDALACEVLCTTLRTEGFVVRGAQDVPAALRLFAERSPDVVVTDLNLPGRVDGVELGRRLRATSEVRLIAVSGAVEPDWPVVRHFDAYLRKPIEVDLLLDLLRRFARDARSDRMRRTPGDA